MLLLEATAINYNVQDRLLFKIDSLKIHRHQRIGIIGRNGSGKTTLLNILAGKILLEKSDIHLSTSIKLVPQLKKSDVEKSGGEITQMYLQEAFNESPGILMVDEPTTHLDAERIEWLERKLLESQRTLLVVSHDRTFLDTLCTDIWEIDNGTVTEYKGNYHDYANQKALEIKEQQTAFEKYEKEKQQLKEAIIKKEERAQRATKKPKNLSVTDARQKGVKPYYANKQKKLRKTASAFETRLEQLEEVKKPKEIPAIKMDILNEDIIRNQVIVRAEQVSSKINAHFLWKPVNFYIRGGDKLAIIGANGTGKTTLIKKIIQEEEGIVISPAVKIGYFSQHLTILNEEKSILENTQLTSKQNETLIRTVLARMNFRNDDVYKKVNVLSGGEKVKVALAKLLLSDVNMLVLDEPTNFLDIQSLEAFETLMQNYQGTVIFVTHDRMLVKKLATKILEINNQEITIFDGTFAEYEEQQNDRTINENEEELLLIETKISDVLSRLSIEPSEQLEQEFQKLLQEKKELKQNI